MYYVYMLTNRWHNVLYTGMTNLVDGRLSDHRNKRFEGFTKKYNCTKLVYFETFENSAEPRREKNKLKDGRERRRMRSSRQSIPTGTIFHRRGSFASLRTKDV